jgi:hypothetical protein
MPAGKVSASSTPTLEPHKPHTTSTPGHAVATPNGTTSSSSVKSTCPAAAEAEAHHALELLPARPPLKPGLPKPGVLLMLLLLLLLWPWPLSTAS